MEYLKENVIENLDLKEALQTNRIKDEEIYVNKVKDVEKVLDEFNIDKLQDSDELVYVKFLRKERGLFCSPRNSSKIVTGLEIFQKADPGFLRLLGLLL